MHVVSLAKIQRLAWDSEVSWVAVALLPSLQDTAFLTRGTKLRAVYWDFWNVP